MKSPKNREGPGGCFYKYKEKACMFDILIFRRHIQDWFESLKNIYINIVQTVSGERGSGGLYVNDFAPVSYFSGLYCVGQCTLFDSIQWCQSLGPLVQMI